MTYKIQDISEHRSGDFIVQVAIAINTPVDCFFVAREAGMAAKKGWSNWEKIDERLFQALDKRALKMANNGNAAPYYAECYMDFIS